MISAMITRTFIWWVSYMEPRSCTQTFGVGQLCDLYHRSCTQTCTMG